MLGFGSRTWTALLLLAGGLVLGVLGFRALAFERERAAQVADHRLEVLKPRLKADASRLARVPRGAPLLEWRVEPGTLTSTRYADANLHLDRLRRAAGYPPQLALPRWEALLHKTLPTWVRDIAALGAGRCCLHLGRFAESDAHFRKAAKAHPSLVSLDGARVVPAALRLLAVSGLRAGDPEALRKFLLVAQDGTRIVEGDEVRGPARQILQLAADVRSGHAPAPPPDDLRRLERAARHAERGRALLRLIGSRDTIVDDGQLIVRHAERIGVYPLESLLEPPLPGYPPLATVELMDPGAPLDRRSVRLDAPLQGVVLRIRSGADGLAGLVVGLVLVLGLFVYVCGAAFALRGWRRSREAARMQADFTAAVSHEMKTPIASVRAMAEMLDAGDPGLTRRYAARIETEMQRLGSTVRNVLDAAQIERGALPVRPQPADPAALLAATVAALKPDLERRGFDLEAEVLPASGPLPVDGEALDGVIRNLVDNAAKFSPATRRIRIEALPEDDGYRIAVLDRGIGLGSGKQEHLFDRFYRGAAAREGAVPGVGLGLHIARQVIDAHGGRLSARNRRGGGAAFEIHLRPGNAE